MAGLQDPVTAISVNKILHIKDIPHFSGLSHEDPVEFILRFETVGKVHQWNDTEKGKHFSLAVQKNSLRWLEANVSVNVWTDIKARFLKTLGKTRFELQFTGESGKMLASEDPLS